MPRAFSSGARSIWSYAVNFAPPASASTFVIAAVRDVLPWSTWPIVPMLQCGFVRSNFAFAMTRTLLDVSQGTRSRGERPPRPGLTLDLAGPTLRAGSASRSPGAGDGNRTRTTSRSEEHTSELQSLMRISYAVFCLKKKNQTKNTRHQHK